MPFELPFALTGRRVFVAGHNGMVGAAICRRLAGEGCTLLTAPRDALDLLDQAATFAWVTQHRPDVVVMAAARVGGILANERFPASFLYENLQVQNNVMEAARRSGMAKLLFLGSSCIYPKLAEQPIREEALLSGPLEPTNEPYAIAKIAGVKLCTAYRRQYGCDFIAVMPTNLYGPGDNYDPVSSHVLPALIAKVHAAKQAGAVAITLWGTGAARREFLHVDDLADACVFLLQRYSAAEHINIGFGEDVTIRALAALICDVVGFGGTIDYDPGRPDGTPRKLMASDRLRALGWRPTIGLRDGIARTYAAYLNGQGRVRPMRP